MVSCHLYHVASSMKASKGFILCIPSVLNKLIIFSVFSGHFCELLPNGLTLDFSEILQDMKLLLMLSINSGKSHRPHTDKHSNLVTV